MASVVFKNIYKRYPGGVTAVNDFNLEVADKEFLVLLDHQDAENQLH